MSSTSRSSPRGREGGKLRPVLQLSRSSEDGSGRGVGGPATVSIVPARQRAALWQRSASPSRTYRARYPARASSMVTGLSRRSDTTRQPAASAWRRRSASRSAKARSSVTKYVETHRKKGVDAALFDRELVAFRRSNRLGGNERASQVGSSVVDVSAAAAVASGCRAVVPRAICRHRRPKREGRQRQRSAWRGREVERNEVDRLRREHVGRVLALVKAEPGGLPSTVAP